jgi:hypothetical protein
MLPTEITSAELQQLSGYAKASITELEQAGVIKRLGKNSWPLGAVTQLIYHLRERGRRSADDDRTRFEKSRADRERLKLMKECGEVCRTAEFDEFGLAVYAAHVRHYGPLAARIGGRDLALRKIAEKELGIAQQGLSDELKRLGEALKEGKEP